MAKDKAKSSFNLSTELQDGDVKVSVTISASGINAANNQATVDTLKTAVQDKLLELGSVVGS